MASEVNESLMGNCQQETSDRVEQFDHIEELRSRLGLVPHPEGGFYKETYRSSRQIQNSKQDASARALSTAIYYLLTADTFSELHSLSADEIFHFYLGDTVELLRLGADGDSEVIWLGQDVCGGEQLQALLPAGDIFGCRLKGGGTFALMGTTVAPGFDFADYVRGNRQELLERFADRRDLILALTRVQE